MIEVIIIFALSVLLIFVAWWHNRPASPVMTVVAGESLLYGDLIRIGGDDLAYKMNWRETVDLQYAGLGVPVEQIHARMRARAEAIAGYSLQPCGHIGLPSEYADKDGNIMCTDCANVMRYERGELREYPLSSYLMLAFYPAMLIADAAPGPVRF